MHPRTSSHRGLWSLTLLLLLSSAATGWAEASDSSSTGIAVETAGSSVPSAPARPWQERESRYEDRFWRVDPRVAPSRPDPDKLKLELHGEYLLRVAAVPNVALASYAFPDYGERLGQTHRLEHRMRFNPRLAYRDWLSVVAQFDAPFGLILGEQSNHLAREGERLTSAHPMQVSGRWLYAEVRIPNGELRVGQQPASWGSGLLLDSGDERQFLGDSRLGTIVERVSYRGKPFGAQSNVELLLATDLVFSDQQIRLMDGDLAARALLGLALTKDPNQRVGVLVMAEEFRPHLSQAAFGTLRPSQRTASFDLEVKYAFPVPGQTSFVVMAAETAAVVGTTDLAPELFAPVNARVERFGALAQLGAIGTRGSGAKRWGSWGLMIEWGYASGDANAGDGVDRRFNANPSRRVGLVLFDEVLRWKQARAASALEDQRLGMRPNASIVSLPTAGGVSGATYLMLQGQYRPFPNLDLRAAALVAQASADLVDPARLYIDGRWTNYDTGHPSHRALGLELDFGTEFRQPLEHSMAVALGAEGGVLFPGRGLADANQSTIGIQRLIRARLGFYF